MKLAWAEPLRARWNILVERWNALDARNRRVLSALAVFLVPVLFYLLIWNPVHSGLAGARARLSTVQAQLARAEEQAALVAAMRAAPRVVQPTDPVATVQQAAERLGLRAQLKRADAEASRAVRVQFEDVSFAALTGLLMELQQGNGMRAEGAAFERHTNPGSVNAQLLLRARGM